MGPSPTMLIGLFRQHRRFTRVGLKSHNFTFVPTSLAPTANHICPLYSPTIRGIIGFGLLPTVGKRTLERFQKTSFSDGSNVNLVRRRHRMTSVRLGSQEAEMEHRTGQYALVSSCENLKPLDERKITISFLASRGPEAQRTCMRVPHLKMTSCE